MYIIKYCRSLPWWCAWGTRSFWVLTLNPDTSERLLPSSSSVLPALHLLTPTPRHLLLPLCSPPAGWGISSRLLLCSGCVGIVCWGWCAGAVVTALAGPAATGPITDKLLNIKGRQLYHNWTPYHSPFPVIIFLFNSASNVS